MQKTNAKKTNPPAISTAKIPNPATAAVSPSPPPPSPSKLATNKTTKLPPPQASSMPASSSDDESDSEAAITAVPPPLPPSASKKTTKYVKNRLPSKNKYLLSRVELDDPLMSSDSSAAPEFSLPGAYDPFTDAQGEDGGVGGGGGEYVHLRVQQRNGRKTLTTVQGLSGEYNYGKVLRDLKRELCCNGTVVEDKELGKIIQLQGDHRDKVGAFLAKSGMVHEDNIKVHGF